MTRLKTGLSLIVAAVAVAAWIVMSFQTPVNSPGDGGPDLIAVFLFWGGGLFAILSFLIGGYLLGTSRSKHQ